MVGSFCNCADQSWTCSAHSIAALGTRWEIDTKHKKDGQENTCHGPEEMPFSLSGTHWLSSNDEKWFSVRSQQYQLLKTNTLQEKKIPHTVKVYNHKSQNHKIKTLNFAGQLRQEAQLRWAQWGFSLDYIWCSSPVTSQRKPWQPVQEKHSQEDQ